MAQKSLQERGLAVLGTSRFLLIAVWATALSSVSSSQKYQAELDKGTDPTQISTFYDMMSTFIDVMPNNSENVKPNELNTWWLTFLGFLMINDYGVVLTIQNASENPIHPNYDIAGACMLTASYLVWKRIVVSVSNNS